MKGNVIGFDPDTNTGAISGHDGQRYDFATQDWRGPAMPRHGDVVDFTSSANRAVEIFCLEPQYTRPGFGSFYFSPSGRISRSQFWLRGILPIYGILIGLCIVEAIAGAAHSNAAAGGIGIIVLIYSLAIIWPGIAVWVKRIHDRNKSGWFILIPMGAALVASIVMIATIISAATAIIAGHEAAIGALAGAGIFTLILYLINLGISIWFFIEFGCLRGTIGVNRFGPDPVRG